jgi:hypothetical protein
MDKHPAIENLRTNQTQLDADGCMVGVSRQAVEETLTEIERLRADGTPLWRLTAIAVAAEARGLCTGTEEKLAEDFLIEAFDAVRAELATMRERLAQREYDVKAELAAIDEANALRAAARQDAEEKARLREALILARREISDHDSDYHHRTRESTIEAIRDALACRPQGES